MSKDNQFKSIKTWDEDDQPREKLQKHGAKSLSNAELLAILIGSGSRDISAVDLCKKILSDYDNDLNILAKKNVEELTKYKGIGEAKAISIVASMELVRRKKFDKVPKRKITSSNDIFEEMYHILTDTSHEEFWVLFLDRKNVIISKKNISKGGLNATVVDPRIIFKLALNLLANSIILVHNHPSGNKRPSNADINLTKKIKMGSEVLDIHLLDHIIMARNEYFSFSDEGLI